MQIKLTKRNTTPLCFMPNGKLVCYRYGYVVLLDEGNEIGRYRLFASKKERLLGRFRWLYRLLRLGIRAAEAIDDSNIVVSIGNMLYELNVENGKLTKGYFCGDRIRPLLFTRVEGIKDIKEGLYFGGYLGNRKKKPVNIYHRVGVSQWEVVFTFPEGTINHVHNIVPDAYRNCLWIFTGDFDESSAIWKVTDNFKKVERIVCNDQKYRGCVAYALPEGVLYATDAPFANDYIYLLNPELKKLKELSPIDGSCIYGCQWKNNFIFSSTVEGDGRNTTKWEFYFGRKRGAGIKDNFVHMYMGNLQEGFKEIYKEKKDCLPYYTFQFGVFKFPAGINNTDILYFQPVATRKHDLQLMSYSI